jgi:hypothetical protein
MTFDHQFHAVAHILLSSLSKEIGEGFWWLGVVTYMEVYLQDDETEYDPHNMRGNIHRGVLAI